MAIILVLNISFAWQVYFFLFLWTCIFETTPRIIGVRLRVGFQYLSPLMLELSITQFPAQRASSTDFV